jgi:hypothetical protein
MQIPRKTEESMADWRPRSARYCADRYKSVRQGDQRRDGGWLADRVSKNTLRLRRKDEGKLT